jgi:SET family sugar efflux transporter-like MFS transporter
MQMLLIWRRIIQTPLGAPLGLCILLQGILLAVVDPLLPIVVSDRIGLEKSEVVLFFLFLTLTAIGIGLLTGYLSDGIVARYKLVLVGGILLTIGNIEIAAARESVHAFVSLPFLGALAVFFPQLFAAARLGIMADWEPKAQIVGITAFRTLYSFGYILGTALTSWLAQHADLQAVFFFIGLAFIPLTVLAVVVLHRIEAEIARRAAPPPAHDVDGQRAIALPVSMMIIPLLGLVILKAADNTRSVYLSLVMFQLFNDASIAPLMFGITAAAELITMVLMGSLSGRIGERVTIAVSALFGAIYFIILSFSQSLPVLYGVHLLYAVFVAALQGVAIAYVQNMLAHRTGMGGSLYFAVLNVGGLIGILAPLLVTGYDQSVFLIAAVLCLVGAALLMFGDRIRLQTPRFGGVRGRSALNGGDLF